MACTRTLSRFGEKIGRAPARAPRSPRPAVVVGALAAVLAGCLDVPAPPARSRDGGPGIDDDAGGVEDDAGDRDASPEADVDAAALPEACSDNPSYIFCDDFAQGLARWDDETGAVSVSEDEELVAPSVGAAAFVTKNIAPFSAERHLRGLFTFTSLDDLSGTTIFGLFSGDSVTDGVFLAITDGGMLELRAPQGQIGTTKLPEDREVCIEMEIGLDELDVEMRVNGSRTGGQLQPIDTPLDRLRLGIITPPSAPPATVTADDIVMATSSIGCTPLP